MSIIEMLIALVIGGIAFFGLAMPFIADRSFWGSGNRQTEAQRDAQFVLRTIARIARQSTGYTGGAFQTPCGPVSFTPVLATKSLTMNNCGTTSTLIDGVRSQVEAASFSITQAPGTRLVDVQVQINQVGGQEHEQLKTRIFLRNAP